jgi:hypothetical protein
MSKIERTLHAWKDIVVKVVTDEDMDDMEWAVVTKDHGDEWLIVKTKDKKVYKYGCFANLKNADYILNHLITKPVMYKEDCANTSNDIYNRVYSDFFQRTGGLYSDREIKLYSSKKSAQFEFDYFIDWLNDTHETSKDRYDSRKSHIDEVKAFLEKNDIATPENVDKLNNAGWDSRIDGVDGIAGKEDITEDGDIYFESLGDVYIVSKDDLETVEDNEPDEWGYTGSYLNFEPDPQLAAEKRLIDTLGEEWDDSMHNCDYEVELFDKVVTLFDQLYLDPETGEALYLVIDKRGGRPKAAYMTLEEAVSQKNQTA